MNEMKSMSYSAKRILFELVDKYDRSIASKQGSKRNIRQKFKITKSTLPEYFSTSGYKYKEQLNIELMIYKEKNWIQLEYDDDTEMISSVTLNTSLLNEINQFLNRKSRSEKEVALLKLFSQYSDTNLKQFVQDVIMKISNFESYQSLVYDNIEDNKKLLHVLDEIMKLNHEEMERVFSVRVLKDSKQFQKMKSKVVHILKLYYGGEGEDEQVLADFNIVRNPGWISLKGKGIISINKSEINLEDFDKEFVLSSSNISSVEIKNLPIKRVITVENLTSFYTIELEDTLFIYLGGYHNHSRRQLLQLIYKNYPDIDYYHFGDIDAGGIYIFEHLRNKTQIPFKPYLMDINTLNKYKNQTIPLTKNDIERLKKINSENFKDIIQYMLQYNIKLEQENISNYK